MHKFPLMMLISLLLTSSAIARAESEGTLQDALRLLAAKQFKRSKQILEGLVKQDPSSALFEFNLANAHFMLEEYTSASESYSRVSAMASPLAIPAQLYLAKCQRALGHLGDAELTLERLRGISLPVNLGNAVDSELLSVKEEIARDNEERMRQCLTAYQKEEYPLALELVSSLLETKSSPEAFMLRGLILVKLGDERKAVMNFIQVVKRSPRSQLRDEALQYVRQIREQRQIRQKRYSMSFELAGGYHSNPGAFADGTDVIGKAVARASAGAGVFIARREAFSSELRYTFSWSEIAQWISLRSVSHLAEWSFNYERSGLFLQLLPFAQYTYLGTRPYLFHPGSLARISQNFRDVEIGASYELSTSIAGESMFEYLEGVAHNARVFVGYYFPSIFLSVIYRYSADNTGDLTDEWGTLPLASRSHGPALAINWVWGGGWELSGNAGYWMSRYPTISQPDGVTRADRQLSASLQLSIRLGRGWTLFSSGQWTKNSSSLDGETTMDRNFQQWTGLGGVSWML